MLNFPNHNKKSILYLIFLTKILPLPLTHGFFRKENIVKV